MAIGRVNAPLGDYFKGDMVNVNDVTPVRNAPFFISYGTPVNKVETGSAYYIFNDDKNIYVVAKESIQVFDKNNFSKKNTTKTENLSRAWHHHLTDRIYLDVYTPWDGYSLAVFNTKSYKYEIVFDSTNDPLKERHMHFTADKNGYTYLFLGDEDDVTLVILDPNFYERGRFEYNRSGISIDPYCINDGYIYIDGGKIDVKKPDKILSSHKYSWVCTSPNQDAVAYGDFQDIKKQGKKGNWSIKFPHSPHTSYYLRQTSLNDNEDLFIVNDLGFKFLGQQGKLEGIFKGVGLYLANTAITADDQYLYYLSSGEVSKYKHGQITEYILNKD